MADAGAVSAYGSRHDRDAFRVFRKTNLNSVQTGPLGQKTFFSNRTPFFN